MCTSYIEFDGILNGIMAGMKPFDGESKASNADDYADALAYVRNCLSADNIDTSAGVDTAMAEYLSGRDGRGLYFVGSVGTGKTRRAKALASMLGCRCMTAIEICRLYMDFPKAFEERVYGTVAYEGYPHSADIVIDDLGTEAREYSIFGVKHDVMLDVLQRRYDMFPQQATHITTNLNKGELLDRYGVRIASRFREMCRPIVLTGGDRRQGVKK